MMTGNPWMYAYQKLALPLPDQWQAEIHKTRTPKPWKTNNNGNKKETKSNNLS
jgi:hypothetical protein